MMAPKVEQPPLLPTDLPGVLKVLSGEDVSQYAGALGVLLGLDAKLLPKEEGPVGEILQKLLPLLTHSDAAIKSSAVRNLAKLMYLPGPTQAMLTHEACAQDVWSFVSDFGQSFKAYREALQALQAEAAAGPTAGKDAGKKAPPPAKGAPPPPDPESTLPGPSKHALDAALRMLATLASTKGTSQCMAWLTASDSQVQLEPLLHLLEHHTLRVQMRAAKLLAILGKLAGTRARLLQAGAIAALLQVVRVNASGSVRLDAVQALQSLAGDAGPAQVQLQQGDVVEVLLRLVLTPEGSNSVVGGPSVAAPGPPPPTAAPAKGGAAPAPTAPAVALPAGYTELDFKKPCIAQPEDLQLAAAKLLQSMAFFSPVVSETLARAGGLQLLQALLPQPPPPAPEALAAAAAAAAAEAQAREQARPNSASKTIFAALLQESKPPPPPEEEAAPQEPDEWVALLDRQPSLPAPTTKAPSPQAQSVVLSLMSNMLALPGLLNAVFERTSRKKPAVAAAEAAMADPAHTPPAHEFPLHELLLHLFAPAAAAPAAGAAGAQAAAKKDDKAKAPAPPAKGAKVEEPQARKEPACVHPPFAPVVRAAALEALGALAKHPQYAELLAKDEKLGAVVRCLGHPLAPPAPPPGSTPATPPPATPAAAPPASAKGSKPSTPPKNASREAAVAAAAAEQLAQEELKRQQAAAAREKEISQVEAEIAGPLAGLLQLLGPLLLQEKERGEEAAKAAAAAAAAKPRSSVGPGAAGGSPGKAGPTGAGSAGAGAAGAAPAPAKLSHADAVAALKKLSAAVEDPATQKQVPFKARTSVACAVMSLPEGDFMARAEPPLPSPPATPPPLPLAVSAFIWDALDRPMMTDGSVRLVHMG